MLSLDQLSEYLISVGLPKVERPNMTENAICHRNRDYEITVVYDELDSFKKAYIVADSGGTVALTKLDVLISWLSDNKN